MASAKALSDLRGPPRNLQAAYDLSVARNAATDHRYRKIKRRPQAA
ncbi:MAG: hypothetical protein AB7K67_05065 [Hyphomicrobiaceae bacterium]